MALIPSCPSKYTNNEGPSTRAIYIYIYMETSWVVHFHYTEFATQSLVMSADAAVGRVAKTPGQISTREHRIGA